VKVAFRVDASLTIGTGHTMRCLTLADALRNDGSDCVFIYRNHDEFEEEIIKPRGYQLFCLGGIEKKNNVISSSEYSKWLGVDTQRDAEDTANALCRMGGVDWLVVDHYGIGARWEAHVRQYCRRILAIDDLANRDHAVDVLLDQNLGKTTADYTGRLHSGCTLLAGPYFALLRPEFASLRNESLSHRRYGKVRNILITMGGVDFDNVSRTVLEALSTCNNTQKLNIVVVLGTYSPWQENLRKLSDTMPFRTDIRVNVQNMAQLMSKADLAIGAAGSTTWERCCLGLPTLQLIIAENQRGIAEALRDAGGAHMLSHKNLYEDIPYVMNKIEKNPEYLIQMSKAAAAVTDGFGARRVVQKLNEGIFL